MPELPDVTVYVEALRERLLGHTLTRALIRGPFLLRSTHPPVEAAYGRKVREIRRIGKQIAVGFEDEVWLVLHLMIAGRLHWKAVGAQPAKPGAKEMPGEKKSPGVKKTLGARNSLAVFEFDNGALALTEAGTQHRASLRMAQGEEALRELSAGGIEVLSADVGAFTAVLQSANHTLKRALTDPHLFSGIGNAYSDEILHRARLSPVALTQKLKPEECARLYEATRATLMEWTERLRTDAAGGFPEKVTAFRDGMAVHGRYGQPCPRCGAKVQRIRYASNETNYCAPCQTGGKLLADRALSRLLREDWPRSLDELEALKKR